MTIFWDLFASESKAIFKKPPVYNNDYMKGLFVTNPSFQK